MREKSIVSVATSQEMDFEAINKYGISAQELMCNAGVGIFAKLIHTILPSDRVLVLCGTGNNGGDGFVIAKKLLESGFEVKIYINGNIEKLSSESQFHYHLLIDSSYPDGLFLTYSSLVDLFDKRYFSIAIDALIGVGLKCHLRSDVIDLINIVNDQPIKRVCVDIPSGLDADTGLANGAAIKGDYTYCLGTIKKGLLLSIAKPFVGKLECIDIGIPNQIYKKYCME